MPTDSIQYESGSEADSEGGEMSEMADSFYSDYDNPLRPPSPPLRQYTLPREILEGLETREISTPRGHDVEPPTPTQLDTAISNLARHQPINVNHDTNRSGSSGGSHKTMYIGDSKSSAACPTLDDQSVVSRPRGAPGKWSAPSSSTNDFLHPGRPLYPLHRQFEQMTFGGAVEDDIPLADDSDEEQVVDHYVENQQTGILTSIGFDPNDNYKYVIERHGTTHFWPSWKESRFYWGLVYPTKLGLAELQKKASEEPKETHLVHIGGTNGWEQHRVIRSMPGREETDWSVNVKVMTQYALMCGGPLAKEIFPTKAPRHPFSPADELEYISGMSSDGELSDQLHSLGWLAANSDDPDSGSDWDEDPDSPKYNDRPGQGFNVLSRKHIASVDPALNQVILSDVHIEIRDYDRMVLLSGQETEQQRGKSVRIWSPDKVSVQWANLVLRTYVDLSDVQEPERTFLINLGEK